MQDEQANMFMEEMEEEEEDEFIEEEEEEEEEEEYEIEPDEDANLTDVEKSAKGIVEMSMYLTTQV